jgi:predicted nucleic acid-binding protein
MLAFDSNILIYATDADDPDRNRVAFDIVAQAMRTEAVIAAQALSEYLNVNIKRRRQDPTEAARQVALWSKLYLVESTSAAIVVEAAAVAARYKLPFWDALILEASRSGGATVLLSEDMQDGLSVGALTVRNPFNPANRPQIESLLRPA